ncbi:hypothetical protein QQ045_000594 [Rhodiola kirilowii]
MSNNTMQAIIEPKLDESSAPPALEAVSPPPDDPVAAPPPVHTPPPVSPSPPPPHVASPPPPLPSPPPKSPPHSPSPPPLSPPPSPPPSPVTPSPPPPVEPKPSPSSPGEPHPSPPSIISWSPPPPIEHHFPAPTMPAAPGTPLSPPAPTTNLPPPTPSSNPLSPAPSEAPPLPLDPIASPSPIISPPSSVTVPSPANYLPNTTTGKGNIPHSPTISSSSGAATDAAANSGLKTGLIVGGSIGGVVVILVVAIFFFSSRRNKKRKPDVHSTPYIPPATFIVQSDGYFYGQSPQSASVVVNSYESQPGQSYPAGASDMNPIGTPKSFYTYEEVMEITNGFMRENILGEGGFGAVYKGWLPDGKLVAVKQLKAGSGQGEREFRAEVEIISRVHHRHLVSLVGYCISEHQRLLIYEFVPNGTLEHHLHGKGMPVLEWTKRMKIALGAARGLAYLHEDCHPKIIHRDIKSANILLDDSFEAQVADFGLAKLTDDNNTHVSTRVMGTFGYMAPEYATSGKLTDRSDVFSFGVVLLELITGRKPVDPTQPFGDESLVEWARPLLVTALETGDISELVDTRLENHFIHPQMLRMIEAAAACVRHSAPKRPRMMQVVRALDCESDLSDLSNGVKYGQSTVYDSGKYNKDISDFRKMAFGSEDGSDIEMYSDEYSSREVASGGQQRGGAWVSPGDSCESSRSNESETRAINVPSLRKI